MQLQLRKRNEGIVDRDRSHFELWRRNGESYVNYPLLDGNVIQHWDMSSWYDSECS